MFRYTYNALNTMPLYEGVPIRLKNKYTKKINTCEKNIPRLSARHRISSTDPMAFWYDCGR